MEQNLVKDLESSLQACISTLLSQSRHEDDVQNKTGVDSCIEKFLQSARHLEGYFAKYQMYTTVNHPQDAIREVILDILLVHVINTMWYMLHNYIHAYLHQKIVAIRIYNFQFPSCYMYPYNRSKIAKSKTTPLALPYGRVAISSTFVKMPENLLNYRYAYGHWTHNKYKIFI
ncbi:mediator of RNA polymerase II transcription subunit 28 [Paramuricea clavata]|uniref:Mediator of RNA polymerase II transcription subunit 28 n=1 Tax=Paramuricea clavata TaxID=317549 RepID=A0A6S7J7L5_PARCT|nr:mediator of RNA polymerase II transcription subunit 28 [Paramuricea clavata]